MAATANMTRAMIREAIWENPKRRARDLASHLDLPEAALVDALVGEAATRIEADPNVLIPRIEELGEVMALTRNESCVSERVGTYTDYRPGPHASMIFSNDIDLRFFPSHFKFAYAVEQHTDKGLKRSVQIFDAAGDAVHKIHLRDSSSHDAWTGFVNALTVARDEDTPSYAERAPIEAAQSNPDKRDELRQEWAKLTDTHQFLRLCSKLKMNRLGAYRIAGAPFVRQLPVSAVDTMFEKVREAGIEFMYFVGNRGCIQIYTGPIKRLEKMGPWQNILDPGFDMHLRSDHIAEVWAVEKPTRRGAAISVEAFDAEGSLIFQAFGVSHEGRDSRPVWNEIVAALPSTEVEPA